jgi:hypothetical protein
LHWIDGDSKVSETVSSDQVEVEEEEGEEEERGLEG